ncbi:MAG: radical SAM family heme chaperone HemW [Actinobacteria bacterium]|nr:radical SAM family heme chaperone HemW [Actinomycetota bacterium]
MSVATADARRTGDWLSAPGFGVYVHIPFCLHRCHYCDFNAYEGMSDLHDRYARALVRAISGRHGTSERVTSVFFGGGTPTLLPPSTLARILGALRERFELDPECEITIEANPETVDEAVFEQLLEAGFNRFSIGVQSLDERVLKFLGRTHSAAGALGAVSAARKAGARDVNADLIYGSPWERPDDWRRSLDGVMAAEPDHVSAYALTIEEKTPLHTLVATGRAPDVDPDVQAERHGVAEEMLGAAGYGRYEISNWARPESASRHNVLYWSAGDYAAFGAGAHGHLGGRRFWAIRRPHDFVVAVEAGLTTEAGSERLDAEERAGEALMLGLRLTSGIDAARFAARFGSSALGSRATALQSLEDDGLLRRSGGRLWLSDRGTLLANEVCSRLL